MIYDRIIYGKSIEWNYKTKFLKYYSKNISVRYPMKLLF